MSECVVRMEMPSDCERCPMCGTASGGNGMYELWCMCGDIPASSQRRPEDCPIICSLPERHGRLVDADALTRLMLERKRPLVGADSSKDRYRYIQWLADYNAIREAKAIVPAERRETEQV